MHEDPARAWGDKHGAQRPRQPAAPGDAPARAQETLWRLSLRVRAPHDIHGVLTVSRGVCALCAVEPDDGAMIEVKP